MEQEKTRINFRRSVADKVEFISKLDPTELGRVEELVPDINFEEVVPLLSTIIEACMLLSGRDLSRLTLQQLKVMEGCCNQFTQLVQEIKTFTLTAQKPTELRNEIVDKIDNAFDGFMNAFQLPIAVVATQEVDLDGEAIQYQEARRKLDAFLHQSKEKAEKTVKAIEQAAGIGGVGANSAIFSTKASEHDTRAKDWKLATIWSFGIAIVTAIVFVLLAFNWKPDSTAEAIQMGVAKIILLSTVSFVIFWCSRNYRSERYNATVNQHRADALATFEAFVEGTNDQRVKDAILLHAAQAAFAGRKTGFDNAENPQSINPLVEIIGKTMSSSE